MDMQWFMDRWIIPSSKRLHNYGKSPFLMGKLTISMAILNSYFDKLPEGLHPKHQWIAIAPGPVLLPPSLPRRSRHRPRRLRRHRRACAAASRRDRASRVCRCPRIPGWVRRSRCPSVWSLGFLNFKMSSGWWWLEPWNFMTSQKQLRME